MTLFRVRKNVVALAPAFVGIALLMHSMGGGQQPINGAEAQQIFGGVATCNVARRAEWQHGLPGDMRKQSRIRVRGSQRDHHEDNLMRDLRRQLHRIAELPHPHQPLTGGVVGGTGTATM